MGVIAKRQPSPWQSKSDPEEILGISFQQLKHKMPQTLLPEHFSIFQN